MIERESDIERKLYNYVKRQKGRCLKLNPAGMVGIPDRMILLPGGVIHFVELKRKGQKPRPIQLHWLRKLTDLGFSAFWADNYEDIIDHIQT